MFDVLAVDEIPTFYMPYRHRHAPLTELEVVDLSDRDLSDRDGDVTGGRLLVALDDDPRGRGREAR